RWCLVWGWVVGVNAAVRAVWMCGGGVCGAGGVVTRSITEKGVYAGTPARLLGRL
ncbi:hypothetical protein QMW81_13985, partial [Cronobacter sakazakii]|nr:hypothetical protein [Cronobacter sakazakii]